MEKKSAAAALKIIRKASRRRLDVTELAVELLESFGGVKDFAARYSREFEQAKGIAKTRMLEGVLRIINAAAAMDKKKGLPLAELGDDDLAALLVELMQKTNGQAQGQPDATAEPS